MLALADITARASGVGLTPVGGLHPDAMPDIGTIVLLGPDEPGFWPIFTASPESRDGAADPMDRWSTRVIGALAAELSAQAFFPFGGPPWQPFTAWARASGTITESPVGLLVHDRRGLFVSFRGALGFGERLDLDPPAPRLCDACVRPCLSACPVGALGARGYDVAVCHDYLDSSAGRDCMEHGCMVRRACPVGRARRPDAQSAFYMTAFHGRQSLCDD